MIKVIITYSTGDVIEYQLPQSQTDEEITEQIQGELTAGIVNIDKNATFTWIKEQI